MGIGGHGTGGDRSLAYEGGRVEEAGNNLRVRRRDAYLEYLYRGGEYGGIQQVPQLVAPGGATWTLSNQQPPYPTSEGRSRSIIVTGKRYT